MIHALGLLYLDNPKIFHQRMPYYAERVFNKCGLTESVWGFIDGTLQKTCHPSYFQKLMYSGHKRCHGIKFQYIVTPDGMFASIYGPVNGNRHDSFLLSTSGLLDKLQTFMPDLPGSDVFSLYGDPAYPQSIYISGGHKILWVALPMHIGILPCQKFVKCVLGNRWTVARGDKQQRRRSRWGVEYDMKCKGSTFVLSC